MRNRPEYDMKIVGQNLKRLRESNGLTVEEVREYLRLGSVQAIYKHESGRAYPQADTLLALMELYGVGVSEIVGKYEEGVMPSSVVYIEEYGRNTKVG